MCPVESGNSEPERLNKGASGTKDSRLVTRVCFGLYEVDLQASELRKGGFRLKIPRQSFQILVMLLKRPGEIVSREELRRKLWPSDVFVNFEASLNSAVQRLRSTLQDTSAEPRYIETLPRVGYRFIASVESVIIVSDQSPSAAGVDSAELPSDGTIPADESVPPIKGSDRLYWAATAIILMLLACYVEYRYSGRNPRVGVTRAQPSPVVPSGPPRLSVAVIGFTNASGNTRDVWLSTAFTEMLATELAVGEHLRMVPEEDVARAKLELSITDRDSYSGNTLTNIRKDIGCDYVVAGSYLAIGGAGSGRVRLDARLQDAVTGDTVASVAVVGSQSDIFALASQAGEQLRAKLGIAVPTSTEAAEAKFALPSNLQAARFYADGLAKLRLYDDGAARDLLQQVVHLQPEYSPAHSALATAWSDLGYDVEAKGAARKAMDLAGVLPQQARLQTEARYHEMNQDWTRAVEIYSRLQRSYPDNVDYGLDLATAQLNMGSSAEAAATIGTLRRLPLPQREDPRIDLTDARIAGELADYQRQKTLAESAVVKSETAGARLLLARAKLIEGSAMFFLGSLRDAVDADAIAQRMFAEAGDLDRSAVASMNIGGVLATRGDIAGAKRNIEQALKVFRKQGDQARLASAFSNLGEMYEIDGDLPKAENRFRESVAVFTKLHRVNQGDVVTKNLADSLQHRGEFREAKNILGPLLEHVRNGGNKSVLGTTMQSLGSIAETQGDMGTALRMYRDAVAVLKETGAKTDYTAAERSLGKAFLREGDFASAKGALSEALSVDRETGAKTDIALDEVQLAELSLAQAGPVDMGALRSVIDQFRLQKITDGEIEAEIVLAREDIQRGESIEAASILRQTSLLSAKSYDPTVRFDVALATAQVRTAQHDFGDARRAIRPALEKAVIVDCVRCQLEARLEIGEIEVQAGNGERGRSQLRELADEARTRGFRLIADRATADSR